MIILFLLGMVLLKILGQREREGFLILGDARRGEKGKVSLLILAYQEKTWRVLTDCKHELSLWKDIWVIFGKGYNFLLKPYNSTRTATTVI